MEPILDIKDALQWLHDHYVQVWTATKSTWDILLVVVAVAAITIWWLVKRHFAHQLSNKDSVIANKDSVIQSLEVRNKLKEEQLNGLAKRARTSPKQAAEKILAAANTQMDSLTSEINSLKEQVESLQKAQWRKITPVQRTKFLEILRNMKIENTFVELFVVKGDAEADSYAMQLSKLLREAGFVCGSDPTRDLEYAPFDKFGLVVLVKNKAVEAVPSNVNWLLQGLKYSDFDYYVTSERVVAHAREDYLALRVGPKPE